MSDAGFERCLGVTELPRNDGQPLHVTPGDPGGATREGLTFHIFVAWRLVHGQPMPTLQEFADAPQAEIHDIFHTWFWTAVQGDELPVGLDLILFEIAFLSGPARAVKSLQTALRVPVTGRMDNETIRWVHACMDVDRLIDQVAVAFEASAEHFGDAGEFERGWFRRIHADVVVALSWRAPSSAVA